MNRWLPGAIGVVLVVAVWEVLGRTVFGTTGVVPPPTAIIARMAHDGLAFYLPNASTTLRSALGVAWRKLALGTNPSARVMLSRCSSPS